jgi:Fe2+ transport system protein FeoA
MGRRDVDLPMTEPPATAAPARATTPADPAPIPLSSLRAGSVVRFRGTALDPESCDLLRALGLTRECQLTLCKAGEPCIVQVRSTRIGLSGKVADGILVVPDTQEG